MKGVMQMKILFRKLFVSFIAVITLGMYIPSAVINTDAEPSDADTEERKPSEPSELIVTDSPSITSVISQPDNDRITTSLSFHHLIDKLTEEARGQTLLKMGPRITAQVEDELDEVILPVIESTLKTLITETPDTSSFYAITEQPSKGLGERIFHLYDEKNEQDIAKFHVRRDLRPLEGYWFNFHYHLYTDNFESHHEIGDIYWDKNVPPKWMS